MVRRLLSAARAWLHKDRLETDLAEEFAFHLAQRVDALIATGLGPDEARRRARIEFGALERLKEECRDERGFGLLADLRADVNYAGRMARRTPGIAAVLIGSLALAIGINALVFSVVRGLVLRPLPVPAPERLVFVQGENGPGQSYPNYVDLRERVTAFEGLAAYRIAPMSVEAGAAPRRAWGYLATGNYFDLLGLTPALGRFFHPADDQRPGDAPFAVISFDEWVAHFGADPAAVGATIRINKVPYTIIGVAPRGFHGTEIFYRPAIWVPMMMEAQVEVGNAWLTRRATFNLWTIGRLRQGVTPAQAEANLNPIAAELARLYPWPNRGMVLHVSRPGLVGSVLRGPVQAFSLGVLALAALVLLLACVNLASLLLARGTDRRREMAVRLSIGAGRGRLVRQLATESLLLAVAGGGCGIAAAAVLARALSAWRAPVTLPVQFDVAIDGRVVLFAFVVSLAAAILFGAAPARMAAATNPHVALKDGGYAGEFGRRWAMRDALIAVQVALSFVLVTACFVSIRGLQHAMTVPLGFEPRGVVLASFDLGLAGYDTARGAEFQRQVVERAARLPGVTSAAFSNSLPLSIDQSHNTVYAEQAAAGPQGRQDAAQAAIYEVSPGFLRTLGIPLEEGRDFDTHDTAASLRVAIVNESFVRQILRTQRPIGSHFRYGPGGRSNEVIGVVGDGKYETLAERPHPVAFNAAAQWYNGTTVLSVRSTLPAAQVASALRQTIAGLDSSLPLYDVESMEQMLDWALFPNRAAAIALSAFGLLALALASTGVYSLVSYSVARRSREIAIRVAIGADGRAVLRTVLGRTAVLLGAGSAAGAVLAVLAARVLGVIVYGVAPGDPATMGLVLLTMGVLGVASCCLPARRALRVDPVSILKTE